MLEISLSNVFKDWLLDLRDVQGKAKILTRIRSAGLDDLGDVEPVSELRIHYGPDYRIYFTKRGKALLLLLVDGNKVIAEERHPACQANVEITEGVKHEANILAV